MVTFCYLAIFGLMAILVTLFDMNIFNFTFWEALKSTLFSEVATGRMILLVTVGVGLVSSMITDFRILKSKKKSAST
ncbi:hypothetical protein NCCP133_21340 [Cytobacillus sp. NCCP-133]|nr:hypothetical protein NCCP133_21340 [Cytobacillus sp. NCCP-133]